MFEPNIVAYVLGGKVEVEEVGAVVVEFKTAGADRKDVGGLVIVMALVLGSVDELGIVCFDHGTECELLFRIA